jgi:hypothetical protein
MLSHTRQGANGLLNFILSPQYVCIDIYITVVKELRSKMFGQHPDILKRYF